MIKTYIINFELESGKGKCISNGNNALSAIKNAIILNPSGKNFMLAPSPRIGQIYGMSTPKK